MKELKTLKLFMIAFVCLQIFFTVFGEKLLSTRNIFPLYTWNIFHTRPDKFLSLIYVEILQIEDQVYDPPLRDLNQIVKKFPNLAKYTFQNKMEGYDKKLPAEQVAATSHLNELLVQEHNFVKWSVVKIRFDPIDYYREKKFISRKVEGTFVAKKKND